MLLSLSLGLGVPAPLRLETAPFYQGDARSTGAVPAALVSGTPPVHESRHEAAAVPAKTDDLALAWKALLKPNAQAPTDPPPSGASSLVAANAAADQVGKDGKEVNAADTGNAADTSKAADTSILDSMRAQEMGAELAKASGDKAESMRIYAQHLKEDAQRLKDEAAEAAKTAASAAMEKAAQEAAPKSAEDLAMEAAVVAERKKAAADAEQQIAAQIAAAAGVKQQVDPTRTLTQTLPRP